MVEVTNERITTRLKVCNYSTYNDNRQSDTANDTDSETLKSFNNQGLQQGPIQQVIQQVNTKEESNIYSRHSDEYRLAELLLNLIRERKPDYKQPDLNHWARHIDLMVRRDGRNPARIERVIRWCQSDEFWQNNILSTQKLRKQFDQLEMKMPKQPTVEPLERDKDGLTPEQRFRAQVQRDKEQQLRNLNRRAK